METLNYGDYVKNALKWVKQLGLNPSRIIDERAPLRIGVHDDGTGYYVYKTFTANADGNVVLKGGGRDLDVRESRRRLTAKQVAAARRLNL